MLSRLGFGEVLGWWGEGDVLGVFRIGEEGEEGDEGFYCCGIPGFGAGVGEFI